MKPFTHRINYTLRQIWNEGCKWTSDDPFWRTKHKSITGYFGHGIRPICHSSLDKYFDVEGRKDIDIVFTNIRPADDSQAYCIEDGMFERKDGQYEMLPGRMTIILRELGIDEMKIWIWVEA